LRFPHIHFLADFELSFRRPIPAMGADRMSCLRIVAILPALLAIALSPAETTQLTSEQNSVLEDARAYALQYEQQLPDFMCTQITHREVLESVRIRIPLSWLPTDERVHSEAVMTNCLKFALIPLALLATGAFAAEPGQLSPEQTRILEAARAAALAYTQQLPDFICTQMTHRAIFRTAENSFSGTGVSGRGPIAAMANGMAASSDTIEEQLTYVGGKESYEVLTHNGNKATKTT
jgi:hypothetical protein